MKFQTINPATEEVLHTYYNLNSADIKRQNRSRPWGLFSLEKNSSKWANQAVIKSDWVIKTAKNRTRAASTMEMGKPITAAHAEIEKCIWLCHHYAEHSDEYLKPQLIEMEQMRARFATGH